jgi:hypothetical protein
LQLRREVPQAVENALATLLERPRLLLEIFVPPVRLAPDLLRRRISARASASASRRACVP